MGFLETCEACGREVDPADAVRSEVSVGDMTCPTAMVFHRECHELASQIWQPDPDSYCTVDPDFPETQAWQTPGAPSNQTR